MTDASVPRRGGLFSYPGRMVGPTAMDGAGAMPVQQWYHDHDGTRYQLIVIDNGHQTLICAGYGQPLGQWAVINHEVDTPEFIAFSYLREKLALKPGDQEGWSQLFKAATGWDVQDREPHGPTWQLVFRERSE